MFTSNPFSDLSAIIPISTMQAYVVAMFILVVVGTVLDMMHKKSAQYFFENSKKAQAKAKRTVGGGEKASLAIQTVANEVLTSGEFSSIKRRLSHLMTMYGFIFFVLATVVLIFKYTGSSMATPAIWPILWHLGALSLCVGGYWFWFDIRVDVASEGLPWYKISPRGDMFILSLLAMCTFALIWSATGNMVTFFLFILASTILFGGVMWSKFSHMFFKPAAAFQKRITRADGSRENLPELADRADPADRDRHSMELLKDAPLDMGLGIKREAPRHY